MAAETEITDVHSRIRFSVSKTAKVARAYCDILNPEHVASFWLHVVNCFYFCGMADEGEPIAYIEKLNLHAV